LKSHGRLVYYTFDGRREKNGLEESKTPTAGNFSENPAAELENKIPEFLHPVTFIAVNMVFP